MRGLPLLVAGTIALTGCTLTKTQKTVGVTTGIVTAVAGAAVIGYASTVPCRDDPGFFDSVVCLGGAWSMGVGGAVLASVGLLVLGVSATARVIPETPSAPQVVVVMPREPGPSQTVRELTEAARTAARGGSCDAVVSIGARVQVLDPVYRVNGFTQDPDVVRCLVK